MTVRPMFQDYTSAEDYKRAGVKYLEPMLAKEVSSSEEQEKMFNDPLFIIEEKFDGTRGLLHFFKDFTRCFSRRISVKTGWFSENSDSLPQLRDISIPSIEGTVIDGEIFIPNQPFKAISSTLNCKWDKAIARQKELGKAVFHAFDILYYKGIKVEHMPLSRRKELLKRVVDSVNSPYIVEVSFFQTARPCVPAIEFPQALESYEQDPDAFLENYPAAGAYLDNFPAVRSLKKGTLAINKEQFYELTVANGGEGVILKPQNGKYFHKRGREYTKVKRFLTREVIILGFTEPTKSYNGDFPNDRWSYWAISDKRVSADMSKNISAKELKQRGYVPVSKFWYEGWIGNIRFGVVVTPQEKAKLLKSKKAKEFVFHQISTANSIGETVSKEVVEVGECAGYDEETREMFSANYYHPESESFVYLDKEKNADMEERAKRGKLSVDEGLLIPVHRDEWVGKVIEVKANELFRDTGKLRHPRYLRLRQDKLAYECTWKDHMNEG